MFDDDNQERNSNTNRFFFFNTSRKSTPILSREGYSTFTTTFFVGWFICIAFVFWIQLQFTATQGVISAMSSSAVDLAALSLAVLGILHEFNKEDRWFKLGLFLIGFIFAIDCLLGFYLVVSWKEVYGSTQDFSITVFGLFLIGFLLQTDWEFLYNRYSFKLPKLFQRSILILSKITLLNRIRVSIPFVIPLLLIWIDNLTPVVAFLLIFLGGIIALLCLMLVTIFALIQRKNVVEENIEDPTITYARQTAIQQIEINKKLQELKEVILRALQDIHNERIDQAQKLDNFAAMISEEVVVSYLRRKGIVANYQDVYSVLARMAKENLIFGLNREYWLIPSKDQIDLWAENVKKVYWFGTRLSKQQNKSQLDWRNFNLADLLSELSMICCIPTAVVEEFVLPKAFAILYDTEFFEQFSFSGISYSSDVEIVFVNLKLKKKIQEQDIDGILNFAHLMGFIEWIKNQRKDIEIEFLDILKSSPVGIEETQEQKQDREMLYELLSQEVSNGKDVNQAIFALEKNLFAKYERHFFACKTLADRLSIVSSRYYADGYYSSFSTFFTISQKKVLEEGIVVNNSGVLFEFEDYKIEAYKKFLETLGLEIEPSQRYLNSENP